MSALLSDPDFVKRFNANNPPVMSFLNQAPGSGTHNQMTHDDGRSRRALPQAAISQSMAEKSRVNDQLTQNALSTTGTFMNKPHMDVQFNQNYAAESAASATLFGRVQNIFDDVESWIPAWLKSDAAVTAMLVVIGYFVIFKSK